MRIGLDCDGLLDEQPAFFAFLTAALRSGGQFVAVLTFRDPAGGAKTEAQLASLGVTYDELHFAASLSNKGRLCRELGVDATARPRQNPKTTFEFEALCAPRQIGRYPYSPTRCSSAAPRRHPVSRLR